LLLVLVDQVKLGAHLIGVRVTELIEDVQGVLPGVARGGERADLVVRVAEVGER
jgi:hypothetical protein